MHQRIRLSDQVFHFGLFLMLSAAILSAAGWLASGNRVLTLTAVGCVIASAARLWGARLRRAVRRRDAFADLAAHPLGLLPNSPFSSRPGSAT